MSESRVDYPTLVDFDDQKSVYYSAAHRRYRQYIRGVQRNFISKVWDGTRKVEKLDQAWIRELATTHPGAYFFPMGYGEWEGEAWDPFYSIIFAYETFGAQGAIGAWVHYIAIPAMKAFGKNEVHRRAFDEVRRGEKNISLAVSELTGGSDVARMKTTARRDGDHYVVNGNKYWITGGLRAEWFVTLVRTGPADSGRHGLSLLLIPRCKGVYTSKVPLQGGELNDTAAVTFANVRVPVENLIGKENEGFLPLMYNFNFERFWLAADMVGVQRGLIEDCVAWAKERETFGERLVDHQVIRHKLADMARMCLACHSLLERVAYQLKFDKFGRKDKSIARNCALLKVEVSRALQRITIEASQIFGGRSFVRGGRAGKVDEAYRTVRAGAIAAGSEEILLDLAVRQAKL